MLLIYEASDINEAHIVAGMLNAEDIDAEVSGFFLQGAVGELPASGFAKVYLHHAADRQRAEQLIHNYQQRQVKHDCELSSGSSLLSAAAKWLAVLLFLVLGAIYFS